MFLIKMNLIASVSICICFKMKIALTGKAPAKAILINRVILDL